MDSPRDHPHPPGVPTGPPPALESFLGDGLTEAEARRLVAGLCARLGADGCPRCRESRVYRLGSGRMRCGGCGYTFHELTGRYMGVGGLGCAQWLRLIALFAEEAQVGQAADELGVAYNTVYKAMDALRQAILAQAIDARQIREALSNKHACSWPPVFGIMERGGWVFVDLVPDVNASDLTLFKLHFRLGTSRVGSVIYTAPMRGYLGLVCCGGPKWLSPALKTRDLDLPLDSDNGFWPFLRDRLGRLQGVSAEKFPYYLKEMEFRWNNREADLAELVTRLALAFKADDRAAGHPGQSE